MKATPYHPFTSLDFVLQAQTRIIAAEVYVISNAVETALSLISDPFAIFLFRACWRWHWRWRAAVCQYFSSHRAFRSRVLVPAAHEAERFSETRNSYSYYGALI